MQLNKQRRFIQLTSTLKIHNSSKKKIRKAKTNKGAVESGNYTAFSSRFYYITYSRSHCITYSHSHAEVYAMNGGTFDQSSPSFYFFVRDYGKTKKLSYVFSSLCVLILFILTYVCMFYCSA